MLEKKVKDADALLLVTDKPSFEIPSSLKSVQHHFTGNSYVWRPYGINCALIGGSVHSRKVAMRLRVLLEGSDFPYMAGVLPRRCSWTEMYAVDPSLETPGPCVLWKTIGLIFEALCLLKLTCWARHFVLARFLEASSFTISLRSGCCFILRSRFAIQSPGNTKWRAPVTVV